MHFHFFSISKGSAERARQKSLFHVQYLRKLSTLHFANPILFSIFILMLIQLGGILTLSQNIPGNHSSTTQRGFCRDNRCQRCRYPGVCRPNKLSSKLARWPIWPFPKLKILSDTRLRCGQNPLRQSAIRGFFKVLLHNSVEI